MIINFPLNPNDILGGLLPNIFFTNFCTSQQVRKNEHLSCSQCQTIQLKW